MESRVVSSGGRRSIKFDCEGCDRTPSLGTSTTCFEEVIEELSENVEVDTVILDGKYVREYSGECLDALREYARRIKTLRFSILKWITVDDCSDCEGERRGMVDEIWSNLRRDPRKGISQLKQLRKNVEENFDRKVESCEICRSRFLENGIEPVLDALSSSKLLRELENGKVGRGSEELLDPVLRPEFVRSKIDFEPPERAEIADAYEVRGTEVRVYYLPGRLEHLYFLIPREYRLAPEEVDILQTVRRRLADRKGSPDPKLARDEILDRGADLLMEIALERGIDLSRERVDKLSESLARFTAGFGIVETILEDEKIQDVYIDAPVGENPVHVYHQDFEECLTNIYIDQKAARVLSSRFRAVSGRPFSEANPTLDLNLENVRVAAIKSPLSPDGLAFAIRRHRSTPWTLPLFVQKNFLTPEAAGLLSLIVDSQASVLIAGSRGAGKTSLLGALLLELLPKYRILCLEDTAELPIEKLRSLGYKAQRLQVKSSISDSKMEMDTEDALRAALRLGESVLVVGEVRGSEAKSLYEAMRIGAAGNSVLGTIHGSSTRDVFERVVYDLDIPPSSFKATDVILVASPVRERGSVKRVRRLVQISEVGRDWKEDPISEDGFADLMSYDPEEGGLKVSSELKSGRSSLLRSVAKKWSMEVSEVLENFEVRTKIQRALAERSSSGSSVGLEVGEVVRSNLAFHELLEEELRSGGVDYEDLFCRWKERCI